MDKEFISRAEQFTNFNFHTNDLTTLTYKNEVRHIISKNWFPEYNTFKIDENKEIFNCELNKDKINKSVHKLKESNKEGFDRLYSYNMKGIGPGEVMLYYLIDNAIIGGGSSAGVDLSVNGESYEVKAVQTVYNKTLKDQFLYDFKLGGTVNLTEVMQGLQDLGKTNKTELAGSKVNALRDTKEFNEIEELFRKIVLDYLNKHKIVFIDNSKKSKGEIINISPIESSDIYIERMTSGTVKPLIRKNK